jgi:hypothetical protein
MCSTPDLLSWCDHAVKYLHRYLHRDDTQVYRAG